MKTNEEKMLSMANRYFYHIEKCEEIIKYLYNHTELFEVKYMEDFPEETYRFFAGKIGQMARQKNKFYETLTNRQIILLNEIKLMED